MEKVSADLKIRPLDGQLTIQSNIPDQSKTEHI